MTDNKEILGIIILELSPAPLPITNFKRRCHRLPNVSLGGLPGPQPDERHGGTVVEGDAWDVREGRLRNGRCGEHGGHFSRARTAREGDALKMSTRPDTRRSNYVSKPPKSAPTTARGARALPLGGRGRLPRSIDGTRGDLPAGPATGPLGEIPS